MLEMAKYTIFPMASNLELDRPAKYGGPLTFENYETLEVAYSKGEIHPLDMKNSIANALTTILKGVREHFTRYPETLKRMMEIEVTR
jgi:tyrosyl-tRNA synthetase